MNPSLQKDKLKKTMYTITGITGQVGGEVARALLEKGHPVRAVVRDARKGETWRQLGCEVAVAEMEDAPALMEAFRGSIGIFTLLPPVFDPSPGFPEARATIGSLRKALEATLPQKVVCISTIGAQALEENLLSQLTMMEQSLGELPVPVTFLRPGWFMENCRWDVAVARSGGVIHSFLHPLDRAIPMVATADVGRTAAGLLMEDWTGHRIVELEGPERISPERIAEAFSEVLGRPVRAEVFPREAWEGFFRSQGMLHPGSRMRMLDGFNEGWITFERQRDEVRKGAIHLREVLQGLIKE